MGGIVKHIEIFKSHLEDIPIKSGQLIFCTDTKESFFDTIDNERIQISDIIYLNKETDRTSIVVGLMNKLYFVKETNLIYSYDTTNGWKLVNDTVILLDTISYSNLVIKNIKIKNQNIAPVTLAKAVYTDNGTTVEDKLHTISKLGITTGYVTATTDYQKVFTIPFPFNNYLSQGNSFIIFVGTSFIDSSRYTISANTLTLNSDEQGFALGRTLVFLFFYNSMDSNNINSNLDGSYITNGTIPINKVDNNFVKGLYIETLPYTVTIPIGTTTVLVDISEYNPTTDKLTVYQNKQRIFKNIDYTISNKNIVLNTTTTSISTLYFEVDKIRKI